MCLPLRPYVDTPDDVVVRYQVEIRQDYYDCKILSCNGGDGASYNYTVKAVAGPCAGKTDNNVPHGALRPVSPPNDDGSVFDDPDL